MTPSINSPGEGLNQPISSVGGATTPSVSVGSTTKGYSTQDTQGVSKDSGVNPTIPTNPNVAVLTPPREGPSKPNAYLSGPHPNAEINIMMGKLEMTFPEIKKQLRESSLEDSANAYKQTLSGAETKREMVKLQAAEHVAASISAGVGAGISIVEMGSSLGNTGKAEMEFEQEVQKHNATIDEHIRLNGGEDLAALRKNVDTAPIPSQPDQGFGGEPGDIEMTDMRNSVVNVGLGTDVPAAATPTLEDVEKKQKAWINSPEGQAIIKENPNLQDAVNQKAEMMKKKPIIIQENLARLDRQTGNTGQLLNGLNKAGLEATHSGLKITQGDLGVEEQTFNANSDIIKTRQRQKDQNLSDFGQTLDAIQRSKQEMLQTQRKGAQLTAG